ncbi:MAG: hypothetical protein LBI20_01200 [Holosporales bacterium]|jgi:hypothetical protein|nr:hypothetical protein [Holosporales bacterium]
MKINNLALAGIMFQLLSYSNMQSHASTLDPYILQRYILNHPEEFGQLRPYEALDKASDMLRNAEVTAALRQKIQNDTPRPRPKDAFPEDLNDPTLYEYD